MKKSVVALIIVVLVSGVCSQIYSLYQKNFNDKYKIIKAYAKTQGKSVEPFTFSVRLNSLNKLRQIFRIEIEEETWKTFSERYKIPRCDPIYYDNNEKVIWVQQIFPGTLQRVFVYRHNTIQNFSTWFSEFIEENT